jgi:branched-chain amino acid transport system ATP-binding protein
MDPPGSFISLRAEQINSCYGDLQILWDVSFEVSEKKITTIIGSNGAGKTTILRSICGLVKLKSGKVFFKGEDLSGMAPYEIANLGVVHILEGRRLFPRLTVQENLEMGAYSKRARNNMKRNCEWAFELFPVLKNRRKQLAGTMSGGEQQMVAIGRGLMADPELLILDEPSLGLMPKLTRELFEIIAQINREGVTILLVEQNVRESIEISSNYFALEAGKIVHSGGSSEFLQEEELRKIYLGI